MKSCLAFAALCLLPASFALAQQPAAAPADGSAQTAPPPPPPQHGMRHPGGTMGMREPGGREFAGGEMGGFRGEMGGRGMGRGFGPGREGGREHGAAMLVGLHMPHGAWWKNPMLATRIGLSPDQVKKLDDLSLQSRLDAVRMHATIEEDELRLEPVLTGPAFDEKRAEAAMDKIVDERAALEKAEAKSIVAMRAVLTPDQWTRLKTARGGWQGEPGGPAMDPGGPGGPRGGHRGGAAPAPAAPTE